MGQIQMVRILSRDLPERRVIKRKTLADGMLGIFNFGIHLAGGQVYESSRNLREQRLKAQALFQFRAEVGFRLGPRRFFHDSSPLYTGAPELKETNRATSLYQA